MLGVMRSEVPIGVVGPRLPGLGGLVKVVWREESDGNLSILLGKGEGEGLPAPPRPWDLVREEGGLSVMVVERGGGWVGEGVATRW